MYESALFAKIGSEMQYRPMIPSASKWQAPLFLLVESRRRQISIPRFLSFLPLVVRGILETEEIMNKMFVGFLALASSGITCAGDVDTTNRGPTLEEYQAAMTVVRRYIAEQKIESDGARDELAVSISDPGSADSANAPKAVVNAGFSVYGKGKIEAAKVTAISADGNNGTLMVGYPDALDQANSGRLVFQEDTAGTDSGTRADPCGIQLRYDGSINTLFVEGGCSSVTDPLALITIPRTTTAGSVIFTNDIVIGSNPFDGGSNGYLMLGFHADGVQSCNSVCSAHKMNCDHSVEYGVGASAFYGVKVCSNVPGGDFTYSSCACSTP